MKLDNLSLAQLKKIEAEIGPAIAAKRQIEAEKLKAVIAKTVQEHGFSIADLYGGGRKGTKVAAKYRDAKTGKTWSGRGRAPLWMPKRKSEYASVAI